MNAPELQALVGRVQRNCHIADARHAAELTLCTYLLQMREFFRWEQGLALGLSLPREAVGAWMAEREALWEGLVDEDYAPVALPGVAGGTADPFDVEAVNAALAPHALLYGAGLVARDRPVFFLADLHDRAERGGLAVLQAGRERARTLLAPPAALGGGGAGPIVLRRESMARWAWERTEAFAMRPQPGGALHAMLAHYGLGRDFQAGLPQWLDDQCETAVWHELGEHRLSRRWGAGWIELRATRPASAQGEAAAQAGIEAAEPAPASAAQALRADALVRALRDQLADLDITLPALLAQGNPGPVHAWFAGYEGLREALFPGLVAGYVAWRNGDGGKLLREQSTHGVRHFEALVSSLLEGPAQARDAARARLMPPLGKGLPGPVVCQWPPGAG
ncbi:MAG: hypothetical protein JNN03_07995 [Rubrivivax sp.]|nr:hypothetical protein [Rubrivivax sp.]